MIEKNLDLSLARSKRFIEQFVPLHLTTDFDRPVVLNKKKAVINLSINSKSTQQLKTIATNLEVSTFAILLSIFKVLLFRYSNQEHISVGSMAEVEGELETEYDLLAFTTYMNGSSTFSSLVKSVHETTINTDAALRISLNQLLKDELFKEHSFLQVMFFLQNDTENNSLELQTKLDEFTNLELAFILKESASGISLEIQYSADFFSKQTIDKLSSHYLLLIKSVINNVNEKIGMLEMLSTAERNELLIKFNDTLTYYPSEKTIIDLFEEQVVKTPDAVALCHNNVTMTYSEVNKKANRLAGYLIDQDVNVGDNIGLLVSRNFEMIIGMYGIMKTGAAYVPIDPNYPIDRQEYIISNSSVNKVVADDDYLLSRMLPSVQFVHINSPELQGFDENNLSIKIDSKQLAYTIYTSGSTGRPKGVMIEHHSVVNLLLWVNNEFNVSADDRLLFITSMCFDLSVYDIFGILSAGGTVVVINQSDLMNTSKIKDILISNKITFWNSVPTTMDYLTNELESEDRAYLQESLRVVFMSGDWIPVNLPDKIKKYFPNSSVVSLGGATEGTVWSNCFLVDKVSPTWKSIPYGKPIANNFFYILNEQLQPVPIGVVGDLYIGGVGVAVGYANDKEKTDLAFMKDPFNKSAGGRMYKTGDLGKMLKDFNMEFIGRKDNQVKIRGYRVELGEIESALRESELVSQVVVIAKEDKNHEKKIICFIVKKGVYDRMVVISHLKSKVPDYMVPSVWVEIDALPLTANGKVDKQKLLNFEIDEQTSDNYAPPKTESEKILVQIWQEVLKINRIGINDNFFEIGGHSLLAVQIITKIKNKTGRQFDISILFEYPDIQSLNAYIQKDDGNTVWKSLVPIKPTGNKVPLYIVHGVGLNVLNFSHLSLAVDSEQPIFGLQAKGINGVDEPLEDLVEIAKYYVAEIIAHNPVGPYAIAGYSIGGFIVMEMANQFKILNKEVKMVGIFDTYADYTTKWNMFFFRRVKRNIYKLFLLLQSIMANNFIARRGKLEKLVDNDNTNPFDQLFLAKKSENKNFYNQIKVVKKKLGRAFKNYRLQPIDGVIYLFRAKICNYYTDDVKFLGWEKYAKKGVKDYEIPGEHTSMFLPKNATEFARILQKVLDEC